MAALACCLCGGVILNGRGNNARPVGPSRCCDDCNRNIVEPHRLAPPAESAEDLDERLSGVELALDGLVGMYSDLVWLFSGESDPTNEREEALERAIRAKYPEIVAEASKDPPRWLCRFEGMLAAFKLAHGLVAGGEDEDLAKDTFPSWEP